VSDLKKRFGQVHQILIKRAKIGKIFFLLQRQALWDLLQLRLTPTPHPNPTCNVVKWIGERK
jgi:hypothetical protein